MSFVLFGKFECSFRPWVTVAAAAGIALTVALGNWQLGRAHYKQQLQERYAGLSREPAVSLGPDEVRADDLLLRRIEVRGRFEPRYAVYLDNRVHNGVPGYHVIMPLRIAGSDRYVLVNRGWIAGTRDRLRPPAVETPQGEVVVTGIAVAPSEHYLELSPRVAEGNVWQNLVLERYRQATHLEIQPVVLQQDRAPEDGLLREWSPPSLGRDTHLAYAFQWYSLALAIFVYYVVTSVRKTKIG